MNKLDIIGSTALPNHTLQQQQQQHHHHPHPHQMSLQMPQSQLHLQSSSTSYNNYNAFNYASLMLPPLSYQPELQTLPPLNSYETPPPSQQQQPQQQPQQPSQQLIIPPPQQQSASLPYQYLQLPPLIHQTAPKFQKSSDQAVRPTSIKRSHSLPTSSLTRKKRECPICHKLFSNLTTHKAIHDENCKPFPCPTCHRPFKRMNDLLRHEKCHLSKLGQWQFKCPFHPGNDNNSNSSASSNSSGSSTNNNHLLSNDSCHHTGYFTRCDTFKNHLKAIHFKYPQNTPKSKRSLVPGQCKQCGEHFSNVSEWLALHIEQNNCPSAIN